MSKKTVNQKEVQAEEATPDTKAEATPSKEKLEETAPTEKTESPPAKGSKKTPKAEVDRLVYIGPSVPSYGLLQNQTFIGNREGIEAHLKTAIAVAPQLKELLIETKDLAEALRNVEDPKTGLHQQYKETASALKKRVQEGDHV